MIGSVKSAKLRVETHALAATGANVAAEQKIVA
jgi:hypothetical protein